MKSSLLQAALALAKLGYKIFPVPPGSKKSYVRGISRYGSGEAWGMTSDPALITKYWTRWPDANIGLPTGWVNRIVVIETDTIAGHPKLTQEGEVSLKAVEQRLGALPKTWMGESPSGSIHRLYGHPGASLKITMRHSKLGEGVDIKGDGGMVVVPPSVVEGKGVYRWLNKLPIAPLPSAWVAELSKESPAPKQPIPKDANWAEEYATEDEDRPTLEEVHDALQEITNDDLDWDLWADVGMRLFAWDPGDEGLALFDEWSQQSSKYDKAYTRRKWRLIRGSPPTRYGSNAIINLSRYGFDSENEEAKDWQKTEDKEEKDPLQEVNGVPGFIGKSNNIIIPYNFWDEYKVPEIPRGIFPKLIEKFALVLGDTRGSDPAGLAMGGLVACGAAIPDCYKLQVKPIADPSWTEEARLWVSLVGGVASIKTSTLKSIREPFLEIDKELVTEYAKAKAAYDALSKEEQKETEEPHCKHVMIGDSTPEAAQDTMRWSDDGMISIQDELGHFFGSMDRYSHSGQAGADRFFWTQTYEGGYYSVRRSSVKHRNYSIDNCGMSLFGAIQPEVIRKYGDNSSNEGLLQRSLFVMLANAIIDKNFPVPPVQAEFNNLIHRLYEMPREHGSMFTFTPAADVVRTRFFNETFKLCGIYSGFNAKMAEHISKWRGIFCRICLILHIVEHHKDVWESNIDVDIAERASTLLLNFLLPHAEAFYMGILNEAGDTPRLKSVCDFILAHERVEISGRDFQASIRSTRGLKSKDIDEILQQLYFVGWITPGEKKRSDSTNWVVNPSVHKIYAQQAVVSRQKRSELREALQERMKSNIHAGVGRGR